MKYCPKCQTIAEESESPACPDCGAVLLKKDEMSPEELDQPVVLTYCSSPEEAAVLKAALEAEDVDAVIEDEQITGLFTPHSDGFNLGPRVMVRLGDAEAALDFLRRKEAGELAITDADVLPEGETEPQAEPPEEPRK